MNAPSLLPHAAATHYSINAALLARIQTWAHELGLSACHVTPATLPASAEEGLQSWLSAGQHGEMDYMSAHQTADGHFKRAQPAALLPGTRSVINVRMNYLPRATSVRTASSHPTQQDWREKEWQKLEQGEQAVVSVYARGRDYHKVLRHRLQQLAQHIETTCAGAHTRVFTDSAPVMEVALAQQAALGWRGKHTLLLHREQGSFFFLGEIFTNLPIADELLQTALPANNFSHNFPSTLPVSASASASTTATASDTLTTTSNHCGTCVRCIEICPTRAITAPYQLDARRCISYLTLEHKTAIPVELRSLMGNRIAGCDDCQLVCPWNKFAQTSTLPDFDVRHQLNSSTLLELFAWSEAEFLHKTQGSALRRIGYTRWLRNLAVALGNAPYSEAVIANLHARADFGHELVREHVAWALGEQTERKSFMMTLAVKR